MEHSNDKKNFDKSNIYRKFDAEPFKKSELQSK